MSSKDIVQIEKKNKRYDLLLKNHDHLYDIEEVVNPISRKLYHLMKNKKTNLVLSADVLTSSELLKFMDLIGPEVAMIKTHCDQIIDFNDNTIVTMMLMKEKHGFLIMEDRKFSDIGNTVKNQFLHGMHKISCWADLVTVHTLMGDGTITSLKEAIEANNLDCGLIVICQASSANNLFTDDYLQRSIEMIRNFSSVVAGVVAQERVLPDGFIHLTPGVNLNDKKDTYGQQYRTPKVVIGEKGTDMIIVGRGIISSTTPLKTAIKYRQQSWEAYQNRDRNKK